MPDFHWPYQCMFHHSEIQPKTQKAFTLVNFRFVAQKFQCFGENPAPPPCAHHRIHNANMCVIPFYCPIHMLSGNSAEAVLQLSGFMYTWIRQICSNWSRLFSAWRDLWLLVPPYNHWSSHKSRWGEYVTAALTEMAAEGESLGETESPNLWN